MKNKIEKSKHFVYYIIYGIILGKKKAREGMPKQIKLEIDR